MAPWSEGRKWVSDLSPGCLLPTIEQRKMLYLGYLQESEMPWLLWFGVTWAGYSDFGKFSVRTFLRMAT